MSNTKQATTPTDNGAADEKVAAQAAQKAEANGEPRTFDYGGHTYELGEGQPTPKAMEYIARWSVDDERMALVLAVKEILGPAQWAAVCERHQGDEVYELFLAMDKVGESGN